MASAGALVTCQDQRGPAGSDHPCLYCHRPLRGTYRRQRQRTYGRRCGALVKPHQLRHSCATLLLNAGAPVLTVQTILGHKFVDTTLGYARLYDGTVAADYYRAMAEIESRFKGIGNPTSPPASGQLLAMVDALHAGTLSDTQRETVQRCAPASWPWLKATTERRNKRFDKAGNRCYTARTQGKAGEDSRGSGCSLPFSVSKFLPYTDVHMSTLFDKLYTYPNAKIHFELVDRMCLLLNHSDRGQ
jgi:hypothetical protein